MTEEPMWECYDALSNTALSVPTTLLLDNHDFNIKSDFCVPDIITISDCLAKDNIHYCHGWKYDIDHHFGYPIYRWIVERWPRIYQKFLSTQFQNTQNGFP